MFTGIIQAVGQVQKIEPLAGDWRLTLDVGKLDMSDVALGDSIAVNGICLTVVQMGKQWFAADVSQETLSVTALKNSPMGARVNLEKALRLADRLGGHLVSGHVDGVGEVVSITPDARSYKFVIAMPEDIRRYVAAKGSITINGVSLTVNHINGAHFDVNIVPHTLSETTLGSLKPGSQVNLEVDVIARYLERLLKNDEPAYDAGLTLEKLMQAGYA